jgi:hypothetical protein
VPLLAELGGILGGDSGRLTTAASVCAAHGKDESYHAAIAPDAVVFPTSTAEVSQVNLLIIVDCSSGSGPSLGWKLVARDTAITHHTVGGRL